MVGEQPQRFQRIVADEVTLVDTQDRDTAAFSVFGGERVTGLGDQRGVVEAGSPAERGHDVRYQLPGTPLPTTQTTATNSG